LHGDRCHLDSAAVERAIELSETKYCAARVTLAQVIRIQRGLKVEEETAVEALPVSV
jgi:uncharacterized OsmC-like protein